MQTISDAPDQRLQEAQSKLRELLTQYVAKDLHEKLNAGVTKFEEKIDSGINRLTIESERFRKNINATWEEEWKEWAKQWENWEKRLESLPADLRKQFIDDLTAQLEQHRVQMNSWADSLATQQEQFVQNLTEQLVRQESHASEKADQFFQTVSNDIANNNRAMHEVRNVITEQQRQWDGNLQNLQETTLKSLQVLSDQLAVFQAAQTTQARQIESLSTRINHLEAQGRKISMLSTVSVVVGLVLLLLLSILLFNINAH